MPGWLALPILAYLVGSRPR